ncbi:2-dehydropantoate 2-reductase [Halomonas saccharevitans]|uniref:2-dehydropantoate 2-reductase n=1 Tax=Halomonas saccharevitans TaxID=416872 RepID=A0ABU3NJ08_9GAMM|nr:2-dehydropantoate 2-reductase [Halomonas saccharevitans]MDT8880493.1 2-dehydropantoate 2-reductase [Halomonas saccharevitans]
MTLTRHWIVGPGALGRLIALRLAGTAEVTLIARRTLPAEQTLITPEHAALVRRVDVAHIEALPSPPPDVMHLTTKAHGAEAAHAALAGHLPEGVPLVLWQNGFACQPRLSERHAGPALCASTTEGAHVQDDARVTHAGHGHTFLGSLDGRHGELAARLAETLASAGLPAEAVDDIRLRLWRKLAVNAAINPLVARFGIRNGELRDAAFRTRVEALLAELAPILAAEGIAPPDGEGIAGWRRLVWQVIEATAANRASMLQDVQAGRLTEHEAILAPLLSAAEQHGLAAPDLADHLTALRARADALAQPGGGC